ncbi:DNA methyltransferase [Geoglobus acetivorans]|uniref:tRNA (guanine(10)-N(2))-dimethyltransferase n=1 Tax=Geoglobus acetivorans TaxID=565033 RepID=A0A0A7GEI2_GEOAI|nr:N2-methylguanosine tRNA methyltransferase [Geoglobus acetivorans]
MRLIFYLSGEFEELARIEAETFLNVFDGHTESTDAQIVAGECSEEISGYFHRFGLIHEVSEHLFSCASLEKLKEHFKQMEIPEGKICVRVRNIGGKKADSLRLERELGAILWRRGAEISVSKPDHVVKVYFSDRIHAGILMHETDRKQFLLRRPDLKPFFRPGAILPRIARSLVNITGIKDGTILDPMCGTGTILVEAGLMGLDFIGIEAYRVIAEGCGVNLQYYGLPRNVMIGDVKSMGLREESVDGIVTDFPYLQSTKSLGEIHELYSSALDEFHRVLRMGKRAVFLTNIDVDDLVKERFEVEYKLYQRLHKSLTRRIYVCRKT